MKFIDFVIAGCVVVLAGAASYQHGWHEGWESGARATLLIFQWRGDK
jgi:hypothetical protein